MKIMSNSIFYVGALVQRTERCSLRTEKERPSCLIVKRIDGMPNGKYWQWEAIAGDAEPPFYIQSYNEWMYEVVS